MLNQEQIMSLAKSTKTAENIVSALKDRKRFRKETNLSKFHQILMNNGASIVENEYMDFWKGLEKLNLGSLIIGRKGKPNRFKWFYNLKGFAKVASGETAEIQPLGKKTVSLTEKRPVGRPRKVVSEPAGNTIRITLDIPAHMLKFMEGFKKAV